MNNELFRMVAASAIRHGLTALSTYLVSRQLLAPEHSAAFAGDLTNYALDILPALFAMVWSMVQKSDTHDSLKTAITVPAGPVIVVAPAPVVADTVTLK